MALGAVMVFALNLVRIVSLFHIALKWPVWMDLAYGMIWQSVLTLVAAMFVLVWLAPQEDGTAPGTRGMTR